MIILKKPRVFKLVTSNQSEFLFQAPDLQSLAEWLDVINEHCISSQSEQDNQELIRKSSSSLPPIGTYSSCYESTRVSRTYRSQTSLTGS